MYSGDTADEDVAVGCRVRSRDRHLVLDAWAPSRAECVAQAVGGLVADFVRLGAFVSHEQMVVRIEPAPDRNLMAAVLDLVVRQMEDRGRVPADVEIGEDFEGRVTLIMAMVPVKDVDEPPPEIPAVDDIVFGRVGGGWRCHAILNVRPGAAFGGRRSAGGER